MVVVGGGRFTSVKQLRKCASNTVIQVLQRGAEAEDLGGGACPLKAPLGPAQLFFALSLQILVDFKICLLSPYQETV